MSIFLADNSPTTVPVVSLPPAVPANDSFNLLWISLGWGVVGLFVALLMGAFRRKSIVGPERLAPTESAWDLLIVFFIAFIAGIFCDLLMIGLFHPSAGAHMLLLQAPVDLATFAIVIVLLRRIRPGSVKLLGLDPARIGRGIAGGLVTVFVLYPLIQLTSECVELLYDHFHLAKAKPHEILQLLGSTQSQKLTVFALLLAVIIAPLTEELLYRGLLQTILVRMYSSLSQPDRGALHSQMSHMQSTLPADYESALMPIAIASPAVRWAAVVTSSAIFAAIHVEPAFLAPIFVLALGLGYVYERTGNLWITITAHAMFNTAQILLFMTFGR